MRRSDKCQVGGKGLDFFANLIDNRIKETIETEQPDNKVGLAACS